MAAWLAWPGGNKEAALDAPRLAHEQARAQAGDAIAQVALGRRYEQGRGVAREAARAAQWYLRAAGQGDNDARYALGRLFEAGDGVKRDYYKAAEWYRLAAGVGGHREAGFALGNLYFHGRGVAPDFAEALGWFRRAAEQGHAAARYMMGAMYEKGWGVEPDPVEAYVWYSLAMFRADEAIAVDPAYDPRAARAHLAATMTRARIAEAEKRLKQRVPQ